MDRRASGDSAHPSVNSATGFITPQGSANEQHTHPNAHGSSHVAPPYTENPYLTGDVSQDVNPDVYRGEHHGYPPHGSQTASSQDPELGNRRSVTSRPSISGSATTERRGFTGSIRSYFHRNSHASNRSHHEGDGSSANGDDSKDDDGNSKKGEETPEEYRRRTEDPQYLLNTILEDSEEDNGGAMVPMSEAAEDVEGDSSTNGDGKQRRQGYHDNLVRRRRLKRFNKASQTIGKLRGFYHKFMELSLITRIFVWWLPLAVILFIPLAVGAWKNNNMRLGGTRVMWIFIWIEVVWGSLWIAKLFAHYMPELVGLVMSIFLPKYFKFVDMFLKLELAVQLLVWTFISFITFSPLLNDNSDALDEGQYSSQPQWQKIVQDVLVALLVSAIVFLVEQVFMYILSTSFHRTRMSLRIENQKKSVNVLIILLDMAYSFFPYHCDEFLEEDESLRYATLKRASKKVGGLQPNNKVFDIVKNTVNSAARNVGNMVADATSAGQPKPSVAKIVKNSLTNRETREILACRIWKSLVMEDSAALTYEDLLSVFGNARKEEVLYMFDILDSDGQDGIDLDEMIESVNKIGRESKQISKSLVDMDGAINKLHYLLMCFALIFIVIIFVGMLAPSSATVLATLGSTLLSMSFLFSATAQEVFQSCVFLFVKHPYDAGDWIETSVPSIGLVRMQVSEMNLMYSVFNQIGVNTRRQVSNSVLNSQFIDNVSRSPPSQINIVLTIGIPETTPEHLDELEVRLNEFVESHPRDYAPGVFVQAINQTDLDRLSLNVCINTRNNQSDIVLFSARRTRAFEFISQCINEIPIAIPHRDDQTHHDPSMPVFHYNIKDMDEAMAYAEKTKGKRKPHGMVAPVSEADEEHAVAAESEGYVDKPHEPERASHPTASAGNQLRRYASFSSRQSRTSRAFSSASRNSQAYGLRSRAQRRGDANISTQ